MKIITKKTLCPICRSESFKVLDKNKFNLYFCQVCRNGFVHPIPKNMDEFYPAIYWQHPGPFSSIRKWVHNSFQKKRINYLRGYLKDGEILDVGSGEGDFGKFLSKRFMLTNLEYPNAKVKNKSVLKVDFLLWNPKKKFDGIVFLESLEHVINPLKYLEKASTLLKKDGYIFVEYPRFSCLESKIFGKYWLQRDIPRHLFHFTEEGIRNIAERANLKVISQKGILSYEYPPYCLLASIRNVLGLRSLNLRLGLAHNFFTIIFLGIVAPLAFLIETIFYYIEQSPIGLIILRKD